MNNNFNNNFNDNFNDNFNKTLIIFICTIVILVLYYLLQCNNTDLFSSVDNTNNVLYNIESDYYNYNVINTSPFIIDNSPLFNNGKQFDNMQQINFNDLNMIPLDNNVLINNSQNLDMVPLDNNVLINNSQNLDIKSLDMKPLDNNIINNIQSIKNKLYNSIFHNSPNNDNDDNDDDNDNDNNDNDNNDNDDI